VASWNRGGKTLKPFVVPSVEHALRRGAAQGNHASTSAGSGEFGTQSACGASHRAKAFDFIGRNKQSGKKHLIHVQKVAKRRQITSFESGTGIANKHMNGSKYLLDGLTASCPETSHPVNHAAGGRGHTRVTNCQMQVFF